MKHSFLHSSALSVLLLATLLGGCSDDKESTKTPQAEPTAAATPAPKTPAAATEEAKPTASEAKDFFVVEISHAEPKPDDPVKVSFPEVRVVRATIDPNNLEAASAELEIAMTSVDSGIPKRDGHLASPDYFDSAKFGTATIKVSDVKMKDAKTYDATSEVTVHGLTKSWPVEFSIVEMTPDSIVIEAEHAFSRLDFGIGKAEGDPAAADVVAKLRVTLPISKA